MDVLKKMKTFDAYPKTLEDFRVRTTSGAIGASGNLFIFWEYGSKPRSWAQRRLDLACDATGLQPRSRFGVAQSFVWWHFPFNIDTISFVKFRFRC